VTSDTERVSELVTWGLLDVTWAVSNIITSAFLHAVYQLEAWSCRPCNDPVCQRGKYSFRKKILAEYRTVRKINSKDTAHITKNISVCALVKALGGEDGNLQEFSQLTSQIINPCYRCCLALCTFLPTCRSSVAFGLARLAWYGGYPGKLAGMTVGAYKRLFLTSPP